MGRRGRSSWGGGVPGGGLKPELQGIADHFLALDEDHEMVRLQARFGGGQERATTATVPDQTNSMHSDLHGQLTAWRTRAARRKA